MKIAVIGNGKTGSALLELIEKRNVIGPFHATNKPTVSSLQNAEVAIVFTPGSAATELIPILIESKLPVVWGSTGHTWPEKFDELLQEKALRWIYAANFSLAMVVAKQMIERLAQADVCLPRATYLIEETHHTNKKDVPSGTALAWQQWLGKPAEIRSHRQGDIKGIHQLQINTAWESLSLRHEAFDRKVFAQGALWAAGRIHQQKPGLISFHTLVENLVSTGGKA